MGEAWFIGERRKRFVTLQDEVIPLLDAWSALIEIAGGTSSFGYHEEWFDWLHYLVPRLLPRCDETEIPDMLELIVSAFVTQHPRGLSEIYRGFRADVAATIGRAIMDAPFWCDGSISGDLAKAVSEAADVGCYWTTHCGLSATGFFCLKYLDDSSIAPWLDSMLRIEAPAWRAQVTAWLVGAYPMLSGQIEQPADLPVPNHPRVDWSWSHCLTGNYSGNLSEATPRDPFLTADRRRRVLAALKAALRETMMLDWLDTIAKDPPTEVALGDLPFRLHDLYVARRA